MKLIDAGEQSVVMSEVKEGMGVASTLISCEILPEHPELVLSDDSWMLYSPGAAKANEGSCSELLP